MNGSKETIIYVTREIERALGRLPSSTYHIVTNRSPYSESVRKQYPDFVTLIDSSSEDPMNTADLLKADETRKLFAALAEAGTQPPRLVVFKNTAHIEMVARERGWTLVNPKAALADKIEGKASQLAWLDGLAKYLPRHELKPAKTVGWDGSPFILQWAHGHTGSSTIFIDSEVKLTPLKDKFPDRLSRVSEYIQGPSFTVNVVASPASVVMGNISYQITGLAPFTDNIFSTIGNDWGLAHRLLTADDRSWIETVVHEIGARMQAEHWRGLFGLDFIRDQATGRMYLIEINARQPASTTFESHLQEERRKQGANGLTTMEAHMAALLGQPMAKPIILLEDGAQIVQRVTKNTTAAPATVVSSLSAAGYRVTAYANSEENADLIRIQSTTSIMSGHGEFNESGKGIINSLFLFIAEQAKINTYER